MTKKGMPADALAVLREAFQTMLADDAFLADAKTHKADIIPANSQAMEWIVEKIPGASLELIESAKAAMDTSGAARKQWHDFRTMFVGWRLQAAIPTAFEHP